MMRMQLPQKQVPKKPVVERLGVSIEEAARMLSVSERTIRELTSKGKLTCKRIGRRVIYSVEVLKAFLHSDDRNVLNTAKTESHVVATNAHQAVHNQQTEGNEWPH